MDGETARQMAVDNANQIINSILLWRHLSQNQQDMTNAALAVDTQQDDPVVVAYFDKVAQNWPSQRAEENS